MAFAANVWAQTDPVVPPPPPPPPSDSGIVDTLPPAPVKEDLYNAFSEKPLPLSLEFATPDAAKKYIQSLKAEPLPMDLMELFFPIPAHEHAKQGIPTAEKYYPYGFFKISDNIEVFLCLEQWAENIWQVKAYTMQGREKFVGETVLAYSQKNKTIRRVIKSMVNPDLTVAFTRDEIAYVPSSFNDSTQTFKATYSEAAKFDGKGKLSALEEKDYKGIHIKTYIDGVVPDEIYKAGMTLHGELWRDAFGEHYAIVTYDALDGSTDKIEGIPMQLHFYHYAKLKGEKRFEMVHQSVEQTKACALDVRNFLDMPKVIHLSDMDKNGIMEATMPYWLDCRNTTQPTIQMHLALWEARRENRHTIAIDLKTGKPTAEISFNPSWVKVPEITRAYVSKLLNKTASRAKK